MADDEIIVICISDGLSGAYQTCLSAAKMTGRDNIEVINSKTLCIPHRLVVEDAIAMRDEGATFKEIVDMCYEKFETSKSFLLPQDFEFLKRGGRLTSMAATLSGLLRIQPVVMQSEDGTRIEKFTVGRNFSNGVNKILEHLENLNIGKDFRFCVSHNDVADQAALSKMKADSLAQVKADSAAEAAVAKMSKAEKVEYIRTALETVDEYTLEQIYEFLLEMEY